MAPALASEEKNVKRARLGGEGMEEEDADNKMKVDTVPPTASSIQYRGFSTDLLKLYYNRLFPHHEMYEWLVYGNNHKSCTKEDAMAYLRKREISFTLENDIYIRYNSYKDEQDLRNGIVNKCPHKIDIGPVYIVDPQKRSAYGGSSFLPVERELIFDIDMTDYGDIFPDLKEYSEEAVYRHWPLMTIAIEIVDQALREDFGFSNIFWVFSGRRGIHCWVCDARARRLTDSERAAIADYLNIYDNAQQTEDGLSRRCVLSKTLHPSLDRALKSIKNFRDSKQFADLALFEDTSVMERVLALIPNQETRNEVRTRWAKIKCDPSECLSRARWKATEKILERDSSSSGGRLADEILLTLFYPRLDAEVSKHMNHLLKSPFCIHPKTGKLCTPIDPEDREIFHPSQAPTLADLLNELEKSMTGRSAPSMDQYVEIWRSCFLDQMIRDSYKQIEESRRQNGQHSIAW